ncbi:MAG: spermidine synthase, partial [Acidobacteriota bacterium]
LAAAASPFLILFVQEAYIALGGTSSLGLAMGTLVRLLLSALVLGLPTFLMGGTLPAVARAVERSSDLSRRYAALLYGSNTLGAVAGALLTTFFSIEFLGVRKAIWAACALNLFVALAARALARQSPGKKAGKPAPPQAQSAAVEDSLPAAESVRGGKGLRGFVLGAAALAGFAFLLMELVWYRMLAPILGGTSYTFGLILAVALLGVGLGGLLYAAGPQRRRPTLITFAATCSLEAFFLALPYALGDRVAFFASVLRPLGDAGFGALVFGWTLVTGLVVLPAAIVAGYQFSLLVALLGVGERRVGRDVGLTYAWNAAGAIVGSIAGGFGLIPLLSAPGAWKCVALLLISLGGLSVGLAMRSKAPLRSIRAPLAIGMMSLLLCTAQGPTAVWRHSSIGAGRLKSSFDGPNDFKNALQERRRSIIWEVDGVESSVALESLAQYIFLLNGKADGSAVRDAPNFVMSGLIGAVLHPDPKRVLVIGLGTGSSAGWLAQVPSVERVDVVEIEPAIEYVARLCSPVNHNVLSHPKVNLVIGDGREFLLTTSNRYDLIFSQPSNPYRAGISSLFSQEFYQAAAQRLAQGGIFLQWLQGYEVDGQVVRTAYATLGSVFPAVESWQVHLSDLLLLAGRQPLLHDLERVRSRVGQEPVRSALDWVWGVEGAEGFYTGYLASPAFAAAVRDQAGGRLNTDDHPVIEFGFARSLGRKGLFDLSSLRALARARGEDRPVTRGVELDWKTVQELRTARRTAWGRPPRDPNSGEAGFDSRVRARQAYAGGDLGQARLHWSSQEQQPKCPLDAALVAESWADAGDARTPDYVELLGERRPVDADAILARWHRRQGRREEATRHLLDAFRAFRKNPWPFPALMARTLFLARDIAREDPALGLKLFEALADPFAVRLLEEIRLRVRLAIAGTVDFAGLCVEALAPFEPHVPWEKRFLAGRRSCYRHSGHPLERQALEDLKSFLASDPPGLGRSLFPETGSQ